MSKVRIYLPLISEEDAVGQVDQTVAVSINGENTLIRRGESVEVSPEVYQVLLRSGRFEHL
ncbi:MAG: hypothetical protein Q4E13_04820 [Clostridia bacterium]|nr:hypothetical protein [Clostridia bacterium]